MKSQRQISRAGMQPQTATAGSVGAHRAAPWFKTTRGVTILAIALGSVGAATAVSVDHASAGHSGAHHVTSTVHASSGNKRPWIY
jgi:hypothetical protein